MQVADSRMIASVGFWMVGSARSSTWTAPGAVITATRMDRLLDIGQHVGRLGLRVPPLGSSQPRHEPMRKSLSRRVLTGHPKRRRAGRTADDVDAPRSVSSWPRSNSTQLRAAGRDRPASARCAARVRLVLFIPQFYLPAWA